MVSQISEFLSLNANITENIIYTIFALIIFIALRLITATIIRRNVEDEKKSYNFRKTFTYIYSGLFLFLSLIHI